jgi:hypothetical protein
VNVDGVIAPVKEMFQSTISSSDGERPADIRAREPLFGFIGWTNSTVLLVRWASRPYHIPSRQGFFGENRIPSLLK